MKLTGVKSQKSIGIDVIEVRNIILMFFLRIRDPARQS